MLWERASYCVSTGLFDAAIDAFNELLALGVDEALIELGRVNELIENGKEDQVRKALTYYRKAVFVIDDPLAHIAIARLLLNREISVYNPTTAIKHLKHVENQGLPGALYGLGLVYEHGLGAESDMEQAISYFEQAMLAGHIAAIPRCGWLLIARGSYLRGFWLVLCGFIKTVQELRHDMRTSKLGIF